MNERLTLRHIAEAAGVSEMTVSRALRGSRDVSSATRSRINALAKDMGYVPNKIAGALASAHVDLIGVVIPSVRSLVFSQVLDGISNSLSSSKLRPVFGMTSYDPDTETKVIRDMLSWRPSGLIVAGLEHNDATKRILYNTDVPVVEIMDVDGDPIHTAIGISNYKAGYDMGQAIVAKGHRNIAFIGTKMNLDYRASKRMNGFIDALAQHQIKPIGKRLYSEGSSVAKGREIAAELVQDYKALDCIYCSTDILAVGALMYCLDAGIDVPNQLGLAGFSNLSLLDGLPRRLATSDSKRYETGKRAAEFILAQRKDPSAGPAGRIELLPELIKGDSL